MNGRVAVFILVLAGCAAAAPAAHHALGEGHGGPAWAHGGGAGDASEAHAAFRAHLGAALDEMGLAAGTRAKVEAVIDAHAAKAMTLMERLHAGEIGRDEAVAEHEAIVASAMDALKPILTPEQIEQLRSALHPECRGPAAR
jgi:hypothetical protein